MPNGEDGYLAGFHPVDDAVIAMKQFSDPDVIDFRHDPAKFRRGY